LLAGTKAKISIAVNINRPEKNILYFMVGKLRLQV